MSDERISDLIALACRRPSSSSGALLSTATVSLVQSSAQGVAVPAEVAELLKKLRIYLRDECGSSVSDRRLLKAVGALQVSAAANGRTAVSPLDCLLLQHMFWSKGEDRAKIEEFLWDNIVTDNRSIKFLLTNILQSLRADPSLDGREAAKIGLAPVCDVLAKKTAALRALRAEIRSDGAFRRHLFLGDAEVAVLKQRIAARASSAARDLQAALDTAVAVGACIDAAGSAQGAAAAAQEAAAFKARLEELLLLCDEGAQAGAQEDDAEGEDFLGSASGLTAVELALSSKEAKRKLSTEDFKAWKKAQKAKTGKKYAAATP